jgi:hypothetical protein
VASISGELECASTAIWFAAGKWLWIKKDKIRHDYVTAVVCLSST